jgi:hypothetical protein
MEGERSCGVCLDAVWFSKDVQKSAEMSQQGMGDKLSKMCASEGPTIGVTTACGHVYHVKCLLEHVLQSKTNACIICRKPLASGEPANPLYVEPPSPAPTMQRPRHGVRSEDPEEARVWRAATCVLGIVVASVVISTCN